jgi:hypothetical protein
VVLEIIDTLVAPFFYKIPIESFSQTRNFEYAELLYDSG